MYMYICMYVEHSERAMAPSPGTPLWGERPPRRFPLGVVGPWMLMGWRGSWGCGRCYGPCRGRVSLLPCARLPLWRCHALCRWTSEHTSRRHVDLHLTGGFCTMYRFCLSGSLICAASASRFPSCMDVSMYECMKV